MAPPTPSAPKSTIISQEYSQRRSKNRKQLLSGEYVVESDDEEETGAVTITQTSPNCDFAQGHRAQKALAAAAMDHSVELKALIIERAIRCAMPLRDSPTYEIQVVRSAAEKQASLNPGELSGTKYHSMSNTIYQDQLDGIPVNLSAIRTLDYPFQDAISCKPRLLANEWNALVHGIYCIGISRESFSEEESYQEFLLSVQYLMELVRLGYTIEDNDIDIWLMMYHVFYRYDTARPSKSMADMFFDNDAMSSIRRTLLQVARSHVLQAGQQQILTMEGLRIALQNVDDVDMAESVTKFTQWYCKADPHQRKIPILHSTKENGQRGSPADGAAQIVRNLESQKRADIDRKDLEDLRKRLYVGSDSGAAKRAIKLEPGVGSPWKTTPPAALNLESKQQAATISLPYPSRIEDVDMNTGNLPGKTKLNKLLSIMKAFDRKFGKQDDMPSYLIIVGTRKDAVSVCESIREDGTWRKEAVGVTHGGQKFLENDNNLQRFRQSRGDLRILVSTPGCVAKYPNNPIGFLYSCVGGRPRPHEILNSWLTATYCLGRRGSYKGQYVTIFDLHNKEDRALLEVVVDYLHENGLDDEVANWMDEKVKQIRDDRSEGIQGGSSGDFAGTCNKCSQAGHRAKDCTHNNGGSSDTCFKCGEVGHRRKDCTNAKRVKCYECDQYGHIKADCPNRKCFHCDKTGHVMALCPNQPCFNCNEIGHDSKDCQYEDDAEEYAKNKRAAQYCMDCRSHGHRAGDQGCSGKDATEAAKKVTAENQAGWYW